MPVHLPGYRDCGSGANIKESDKAGGPINELDEICRTHDLNLAEHSELSQREADKKFIKDASQNSWLGNVLAAIIARKQTLTDAQPELRKYLHGQTKGTKKSLQLHPGQRISYPNRIVRPNNSTASNNKRKEDLSKEHNIHFTFKHIENPKNRKPDRHMHSESAIFHHKKIYILEEVFK
ncbi:hypothetical protein AVEN_191174-1 [Araneus ventricosus]|uniref:Phospholipase A2-like domain-containing protein n=1 Tax=Araneus ventricosus TaxID=182803 RepID=A0A4Y2B075_ARAVE|nr:hypothetical protein AVEN_191174-1 [Araneus ventricosus]